MRVVKQEEWSPLIEELEEQTPNKGWIIQENLKVGEAFKIKKLEPHFILILDGVLRMENENKQILHFFAKDNVIYQSPFDLRVDDKLILVAETKAKLVLLHREFFLNYASNKPHYFEKLMRAIMENSANFMFELMKNDISAENRLAYSFQNLCQSLNLPVEDGFSRIPSFITKQKMAQYSNLSRKSIYSYLDKLIQKDFLKVEDDDLWIRSTPSYKE